MEKRLCKGSPTGSYVALDLETSGLDKEKDKIIEVGCIKFDPSDTKTEKLSYLINPKLDISDFIKELTGINQHELNESPIFEEVADNINQFLRDQNGNQHTIIAHNSSFDVGFLKKNGINITAPVFDTYDLAFTLLADSDYGLQDLAKEFNIDSGSAHRALSDAETTMKLFLVLSERLYRIPKENLNKLAQLDYSFGSPYQFAPSKLASIFLRSKGKIQEGSNSDVKLKPVPKQKSEIPIFNTEHLTSKKLFSDDGILADVVENYEKRQNQIQMFDHVDQAVLNKQNLLIEAYPGTGKTLSYLLSAAKYILESKESGKQNPRVIISTNSISLQHQIMNKDWPIVCSVLEKTGVPAGEIKIRVLKGRSNYLCRSKWEEFIPKNINELRVGAKTAIWLPNGSSGDRAELNFKGLERNFYRISAEGSKQCVYNYPNCFLRKVREEAHQSDLLIVNHSLAITGMDSDKNLIPPHDVLVIDEGHHLEDVATSVFGFNINELEFLGVFRDILDDNHSLNQLKALFTKNKLDFSLTHQTAEKIEFLIEELKSEAENIGNSLDNLFQSFNEAMVSFLKNKFNERTLRLTRDFELINPDAWLKIKDDIKHLLGKWEITNQTIEEVEGFFEGANQLLIRSQTSFEVIEDYAEKIHKAIIERPDNYVFWMEIDRNYERIALNGAPISISEKLANILFQRESSTVITGATLGEGGSFENFKNSIGFHEGLSIPKMEPSFDYESSTLFVAVSNLNGPNNNGYIEDISRSIIDISSHIRDRILVLFTSYSALNAVRIQIEKPLKEIDIRVVSQGVNGSADKIVKVFKEEEDLVVLGTGPMWEGVDFQESPLKAVILPKLPFAVPTHPVFQARSEQYLEPFVEFAVPDAVKKFQQGFGRLIRSKKDFGAFIILDKRIVSKRYGQNFIDSIPGYDWLETEYSNLGEKVQSWINNKNI